jgi:hypothetical protein
VLYNQSVCYTTKFCVVQLNFVLYGNKVVFRLNIPNLNFTCILHVMQMRLQYVESKSPNFNADGEAQPTYKLQTWMFANFRPLMLIYDWAAWATYLE